MRGGGVWCMVWYGWLNQVLIRLIKILPVRLKLELSLEKIMAKSSNFRWPDFPFVEGVGLYGR